MKEYVKQMIKLLKSLRKKQENMLGTPHYDLSQIPDEVSE